MSEAKRKLSAIFSADVRGYSKLMGEDEAFTVATITACLDLMTQVIQYLMVSDAGFITPFSPIDG